MKNFIENFKGVSQLLKSLHTYVYLQQFTLILCSISRSKKILLLFQVNIISTDPQSLALRSSLTDPEAIIFKYALKAL